MVSFQLVAGITLVGFMLAALLLWYCGRGRAAYQAADGVAVSVASGRPRVAQRPTAVAAPAATVPTAALAPAALAPAAAPPAAAWPASVPTISQAVSQPVGSRHGLRFQLAHAQTGRPIWTYAREGVALGFVRDVVRLRSHLEAAQFELRLVESGARTTTLARGEQLVRLALEDQVL